MKCFGLSPFRLAQETSCFALATLLSCGPSQLFGVVKLLLDGYLYWSVRSQIKQLSAGRVSLQNWEEFKSSPLANLIAQKLLRSVDDLSQDAAEKYLDAKQIKRTAKISRLYRSLKADLCALIPFLGAHISWRVATNYKGFSFTPILSKGVQQLFENYPKLASLLLFIGRTKSFAPLPSDAPTPWLSTSTKKRFLQVAYRGPEICDVTKVVVLFHANAMTGDDMDEIVAPFYWEQGYRTLSVTIGGYGAIKGVTTSEKSLYQDIEAIKQILLQSSITQVGYHGLSLGCSAAIHAAAYESGKTKDLKTLFVVADQPFTSAIDVARNVGGPFGEGLFTAGLPKGIDVELPGGAWIQTDGLDNAEKMARLKEKNIRLVCLEADQDHLMGRAKANGVYTENFAKDLLAKRYDSPEERQKGLITLQGPHCASFIRNEDAKKRLAAAIA